MGSGKFKKRQQINKQSKKLFMKKKKNIFENKLQELNKLKVESKKEVLAKEQKEKDEEKKLEEYSAAETRKYLKGFDKERSDLKKFIKEVNKKFYKKYKQRKLLI